MGLLVDESEGASTSRILRGNAIAVGGQPPVEIDGDPRVEGAVAATEDVDAPGRHGER